MQGTSVVLEVDHLVIRTQVRLALRIKAEPGAMVVVAQLFLTQVVEGVVRPMLVVMVMRPILEMVETVYHLPLQGEL